MEMTRMKSIQFKCLFVRDRRKNAESSSPPPHPYPPLPRARSLFGYFLSVVLTRVVIRECVVRCCWCGWGQKERRLTQNSEAPCLKLHLQLELHGATSVTNWAMKGQTDHSSLPGEWGRKKERHQHNRKMKMRSRSKQNEIQKERKKKEERDPQTFPGRR